MYAVVPDVYVIRTYINYGYKTNIRHESKVSGSLPLLNLKLKVGAVIHMIIIMMKTLTNKIAIEISNGSSNET